eukprot:1185207-Prorocentrum_minimum.AAC.3
MAMGAVWRRFPGFQSRTGRRIVRPGLILRFYTGVMNAYSQASTTSNRPSTKCEGAAAQSELAFRRPAAGVTKSAKMCDQKC